MKTRAHGKSLYPVYLVHPCLSLNIDKQDKQDLNKYSLEILPSW